MELMPEDYAAIQNLYARYAISYDTGDLERWIRTWTEDGETVVPGGSGKGRDTLRARAEAGLSNPEYKGYHVITNLLIEPTDEGARGTCYLLRLIAPDVDGVRQMNTAELQRTYLHRDDLVKIDGEWLFRKRTLNELS